jgi:site-specific recombinase XerD
MDTQLTTIVTSTPLDVLIASWLHAKFQKSSSGRTRALYQQILTDFREALLFRGFDLDRVETLSDRQQVTMIAQAFAATPKSEKREASLSAATVNQRLSALSSFYAYAIKREFLTHNPIGQVERGKVQSYRNAQALDPEDIAARLDAIDRETLKGARDYALLAVLLQTGRRLAEVQALVWSNVKISQGKVTLTFEHCKGNKTMMDELPRPVGDALLKWVHFSYGRDLRTLAAETPLWISVARGASRGKQLGVQSIADVCEDRLGNSKVHATRHTWAHTMEAAGAQVSEIQARLGHESLATTGRYLASLKRAENRHADKVAAMLGIR